MIGKFFKKKNKHAVIPPENVKRTIPKGIMTKCKKCGVIQYSKELQKNLKVCISCGFHFRLNAYERINFTVDEETFAEYDQDLIASDPLSFPGYSDKLERNKKSSGLKDAVITGEATIGGFPVVIAAMSFDFYAGSMGGVVGEKLVKAIEKAREKKCPLIIFSTSGGARMEEGILSLMQLAKVSVALSRFDKAGGLFISVITDPTYGGVSASFVMQGDITIAEPKASFGFAGRRVIEQTIGEKLPSDFQTSEFNFENGQLDKIVERKEMRNTLIKALDIHQISTNPHLQ
ncbi:acetyl-CoA carboxylase, carboxyltransferase subunit beta [Bacillus sp. SD088]|uniref:acetyl-CoA carboxylase, carboxyltransferase subunit beta n=1 Tax=Bacillus sp. SD088 TaxID=2782012 RepID=UPI001A976013|nr:acetyl-CoA carboxylase, carboxyltransferase subunit beta [Bacillus sp. SD088]MBO0995015.1 acetyl-CoA carboxylase carboxyltransferase subunit beta [Bacillus sp. SD088]